MAVTIRDVAEAAGVSSMAVSKVLHGRGTNVRVSAETAEAIKRAASELRYQPNVLARSLRSRRTHTLGLIFNNFGRLAGGSQYMVQLLDGMTSAAFQAGYSLTICPKLAASDSVSLLNDGRFDGVVWGKVLQDDEMLEHLEHAPVPVVALHISHPTSLGRTSFVCCDNDGGLELAVDHLYRLGHRRIAFVADQENLDAQETRLRGDAFKKAMTRRNLSCSDTDVLCWHESGTDLVEYWRAGARHTALILKSEEMAGNVLGMARGLGIQVPEDLSIVGFDSSPYCEATTPRMTAIRQPIEQMASKAVQLLVDCIEGRADKGQHLVFPCGFDIRESTSRPRG
ncbi:MAG TPA: LacI family DNA-binding transcriptional regulator [Fimbriimonadaceae bacterium]|nr:LacI family DNA-binding transcriptional regulator [Fimbriimonadaceae bacterium]